jgi:hypothetical protein
LNSAIGYGIRSVSHKATSSHFKKEEDMKRVVGLFLLLAVLFTGCATEGNPGGLSEREAGLLAGGGLGAGLGAIIGHQTGHAGAGTAIGAGAGALAGALAGEGMRRSKENAKQEMRQEMMQQQYQQGYAPQYAAVPQQQYAQPQVIPQAPLQQQEVHTKYNPRTGQTFPDRYQYDPATGEQLKYLK